MWLLGTSLQLMTRADTLCSEGVPTVMGRM